MTPTHVASQPIAPRETAQHPHKFGMKQLCCTALISSVAGLMVRPWMQTLPAIAQADSRRPAAAQRLPQSQQAAQTSPEYQDGNVTSSELKRFEPGTLPHSRIDTIARCWTGPTDPNEVRRHLQSVYCLYSEKYNVSSNHCAKTGCSTRVYVMKQYMDAVQRQCFKVNIDPGLLQVVTTRHPFSRFVSGYKEMLHRHRIYKGIHKMNPIPEEYSRFLSPIQNWTATEKQELFEAKIPELLALKTKMFETFVEDYDAKTCSTSTCNSKLGGFGIRTDRG